MKIGVAIPSYKKDIIFLDRCLRSIEKQTRLPDIVVISASSCKTEDVKIATTYSFPIKILVEEKEQNASTNRNKAANFLLSDENVDVISFFDSDDEMLPNRLEFIEKAFFETNCDFVVHDYITIKSYNTIVKENEGDTFVCFKNCIIPHKHDLGVSVNIEGNNSLTHGNVSVSKNIWENEKFREEKEYMLWEDSEYCRRLCHKYIGSYIQSRLTKYHNYKETAIDYYNMLIESIERGNINEINNFLKFGIDIASEGEKNMFIDLKEKKYENKENMDKITKNYRTKCETVSDINEHLPVISSYVEKCETVTEFGMRSVISTWAMLYGLTRDNNYKNKRLVSVDLNYNAAIEEVKDICNSLKIDFYFVMGNDIKIEIEQTDLLFIDTWHIYGHLKRELEKHHNKVNKYIILHDTTIDGELGETFRNGWDANQQSIDTGYSVEEIRRGLRPAVEEFILKYPIWKIEKQYTNNNGLTILSRL